MISKLFLPVLGLWIVSSSIAITEEKIILCYYGTWATYRNGLGKFDVDNIDVNLCTHLVYTFVGINNQGFVISLDPWLDLPDNWGRNNFGKFNELKLKNPKLKTILAVGGWNEGSAKYSVMAANPLFRNNFVTSALSMVRTYGFDGFDVDWEYPNRRDTVHGEADVANFVQVLKELKEAFEPHGLLVTAAVAAVEQAASLSYDISAISKYLDLINVMTYDMYGAWDSVTGHNSPLHKGQGDEGVDPEDLFTVDLALKYWLDQGCPPEKLVLGLPLYGRTFTLSNPNVNGVRAPSSGEGIAGPFTATNGYIGYNEFCSRLQSENWDVRFDDLARVPYAVRERNWVSFDNVDSLLEKLDYGFNLGIAGVMVWSIETDDFHGICHGESFPLMKALNRAAGKIIDSTPTSTSSTMPSTTLITPPSTTLSTTSSTISTSSATTISTNPSTTLTPSTPFSTTTSSSGDSTTSVPSGVCKQAGFAADPNDCSSFYVCIALAGQQFQAVRFTCPDNLSWDQSILVCNWSHMVKCST